MYEFAILSLLTEGPKHGYLIAKILNDINGPFAKVSSGRLYPLLAKLQEEGLIVAQEAAPSGQGDRRQRTFAITDAGRERFHQLMMDTTSNPGDYQRLFWLKLPFLLYLRPSERLYLLDHYLNYCQTLIFHYTNEIHEMEEFARHKASSAAMNPAFIEGVNYVQQRFKNQWQLELDQVREWRAREITHAEGLQDTATAPATTAADAPEGRKRPANPSNT